ncbi:MAG: hypothetical protein ACOY3D_02490, partial [Candidatus Omnitrophota bacterium]
LAAFIAHEAGHIVRKHYAQTLLALLAYGYYPWTRQMMDDLTGRQQFEANVFALEFLQLAGYAESAIAKVGRLLAVAASGRLEVSSPAVSTIETDENGEPSMFNIKNNRGTYVVNLGKGNYMYLPASAAKAVYWGTDMAKGAAASIAFKSIIPLMARKFIAALEREIKKPTPPKPEAILREHLRLVKEAIVKLKSFISSSPAIKAFAKRGLLAGLLVSLLALKDTPNLPAKLDLLGRIGALIIHYGFASIAYGFTVTAFGYSAIKWMRSDKGSASSPIEQNKAVEIAAEVNAVKAEAAELAQRAGPRKAAAAIRAIARRVSSSIAQVLSKNPVFKTSRKLVLFTSIVLMLFAQGLRAQDAQTKIADTFSTAKFDTVKSSVPPVVVWASCIPILPTEVIHELSHAAMLKLFGVGIKSFRPYPTSLFVSDYNPDNPDRGTIYRQLWVVGYIKPDKKEFSDLNNIQEALVYIAPYIVNTGILLGLERMANKSDIIQRNPILGSLTFAAALDITPDSINNCWGGDISKFSKATGIPEGVVAGVFTAINCYLSRKLFRAMLHSGSSPAVKKINAVENPTASINLRDGEQLPFSPTHVYGDILQS